MEDTAHTVGDAITDFLNGLASGVQGFVGNSTANIKSFIDGAVGLARGAVVKPVSGGTIERLGEGGLFGVLREQSNGDARLIVNEALDRRDQHARALVAHLPFRASIVHNYCIIEGPFFA